MKAVIFEKETGKPLVRWPVDARELLRTGKYTQRLPEGVRAFPVIRQGGLLLIDDKEERNVMAPLKAHFGPSPQTPDEEAEFGQETLPDDENYVPGDEEAWPHRRARVAPAEEVAPTQPRRRGRPTKAEAAAREAAGIFPRQPNAKRKINERAAKQAAEAKERLESEIQPPETPGDSVAEQRLVGDAEFANLGLNEIIEGGGEGEGEPTEQ